MRRGLLADKKASADFGQAMGPPTSNHASSVILLLPNGVRLEFRGDLGAEQMHSLFAAATSLL